MNSIHLSIVSAAQGGLSLNSCRITRMETNGIIVCRPQGGLNDMFCQIYKCLRYAIRYNRLVLVDTETNPKFLEPLSFYFTSLSPHLKFIDRGEANKILRDSGSAVRSNIPWDYETVWDTGSHSFIEKMSQKTLTFDFRRTHSEKVLIHHQAGGGLDSARLLLLMSLTPHLMDVLTNRLAAFPKEYVAAHVRYSDYESDYMNLLPNTLSKKRNMLFLSTDNDQVIEWLKVNLPWVQTVDYQKSKNRNIEALCDLFMLANARTIIPVPLVNNEVAFSGYSRLASLIWASLRPSLLKTDVSQLGLVLRAIGGVRNPVMSILRMVAFSPLVFQSRLSRFGVIAEMRGLIRKGF